MVHFKFKLNVKNISNLNLYKEIFILYDCKLGM